jgi:ATP-binding protein involved in chromosome partitioning
MPLKMFKEKQLAGIQEVKKIIGVASGKGGVGKSTVATHLALSLKKLGFSVGLLDADLYGPSIKRMLPVQSPPSQNENLLTPAESQGIKTISMSHFRSEHEASLVRAPIANGIITQFIEKVQWGKLDYLVIDFPPGTGDIQLTVCQKLPITGVILVTTPQKVALMDVLKALQSFEELKVPIVGIVENMSFWKNPETGEKISFFGKEGGRYLAQSSGLPFLGQIPIDPTIAEACDEGKALSEHSCHPFDLLAQKVSLFQPNSKMAQVLLNDASKIEVRWPNGKVKAFEPSILQKMCPCAACLEGSKVDPKVLATKVVMAGQYGFRVRFSSGCSGGIFELGALENA